MEIVWQSEEFTVNQTSSSGQDMPELLQLADGRVFFAWSAGTAGEYTGRIFELPPRQDGPSLAALQTADETDLLAAQSISESDGPLDGPIPATIESIDTAIVDGIQADRDTLLI